MGGGRLDLQQLEEIQHVERLVACAGVRVPLFTSENHAGGGWEIRNGVVMVVGQAVPSGGGIV